MDHRYGRHGSRAWLRWRQHRYARPSPSLLPVPVDSTTTIRLFVPADIGRIIFIVIQNNEGFNREPEIAEQELEPITGSFSSAPLQIGRGMQDQGNAGLSSKIENRAFRDARRIKEAYKDGVYIISFKQEEIDTTIEDIIENHFNENGESFDDSTKYDDIIRTQKRIYIERLTALINSSASNLKIFREEWETHLRRLAISDKNQASSDSILDQYVRDKGVLRVLECLHISIEEAYKHLEAIHNMTDFYQHYYFKPGEEKSWPDQDYFRRG